MPPATRYPDEPVQRRDCGGVSSLTEVWRANSVYLSLIGFGSAASQRRCNTQAATADTVVS